MAVNLIGGIVRIHLVETVQLKKENYVKDIMARVVADLQEEGMFVGITELIQKEKRPNLVVK